MSCGLPAVDARPWPAFLQRTLDGRGFAGTLRARRSRAKSPLPSPAPRLLSLHLPAGPVPASSDTNISHAEVDCSVLQPRSTPLGLLASRFGRQHTPRPLA